MSDGFSPTDAMKKEALKGLAWRKEFNRGGTMVGVARARDIANGANLSLDTIKRMNSFFARHEVDKKAEGFRPGEKGFPSNGRIAWALWGGDAGKAWASSQLNLVQGATMIFPEDEDFLAHYGKKGMKWGVRKTNLTSTTKNKANSLVDKAKKNKKQIAKVAGTTAVLAAAAGVSAYAISNRSKTTSTYVNRFETVKKTVDMSQKVKDVSKKPEVSAARKALEELYTRNPNLRPKPGQKPSMSPTEAKKMIPELVARQKESSEKTAALIADINRRFPA
jgi:hypothetical protein